jgi:hypothetical protein
MTYQLTQITKEMRVPQTDDRITVTEKTCENCSRNQDNLCLAGNKHIYDMRQLPPKFGGCGDLTKWRKK